MMNAQMILHDRSQPLTKAELDEALELAAAITNRPPEQLRADFQKIFQELLGRFISGDGKGQIERYRGVYRRPRWDLESVEE